jgi:hypothetical protein
MRALVKAVKLAAQHSTLPHCHTLWQSRAVMQPPHREVDSPRLKQSDKLTNKITISTNILYKVALRLLKRLKVPETNNRLILVHSNSHTRALSSSRPFCSLRRDGRTIARHLLQNVWLRSAWVEFTRHASMSMNKVCRILVNTFQPLGLPNPFNRR